MLFSICFSKVAMNVFQNLDITVQHALKNINNCFNTNKHTYLDTSGGQSSNLYLNVVNFFNTSVN